MITIQDVGRRALALGLVVPFAVGGVPPRSLAEEGPAAEPSTEFLRFVDLGNGEGRLETAVVTYVKDLPPDAAARPEEGRGKARGKRRSRVRVDLIAAVHVADGSYYRELQERFEAYDPLLYEMIKPADVVPVPGERSDNLLGAFQRGLKDMLGLEFQLDGLDYRKGNFVHADLDPETFFRLQREKGESALSLLWKAFRADLKAKASGEGRPEPNLFELLLAFSSSDRSRSLKLLLGRQMEGMERMMAGFEEEGGESVIVAERNKVAVRALEQALRDGKRRIGIFYGGGHMPDLERRLVRDLGFRKARAEWLVAWDIRKDVSKDDARKREGGGAKVERSREPGARPRRIRV
jgi:hypothetical protein